MRKTKSNKPSGAANGVRRKVDFIPAFLIVSKNGVIRMNPRYRGGERNVKESEKE